MLIARPNFDPYQNSIHVAAAAKQYPARQLNSALAAMPAPTKEEAVTESVNIKSLGGLADCSGNLHR